MWVFSQNWWATLSNHASQPGDVWDQWMFLAHIDIYSLHFSSLGEILFARARMYNHLWIASRSSELYSLTLLAFTLSAIAEIWGGHRCYRHLPSAPSVDISSILGGMSIPQETKTHIKKLRLLSGAISKRHLGFGREDGIFRFVFMFLVNAFNYLSLCTWFKSRVEIKLVSWKNIEWGRRKLSPRNLCQNILV